jgi:hypothetical protein
MALLPRYPGKGNQPAVFFVCVCVCLLLVPRPGNLTSTQWLSDDALMCATHAVPTAAARLELHWFVCSAPVQRTGTAVGVIFSSVQFRFFRIGCLVALWAYSSSLAAAMPSNFPVANEVRPCGPLSHSSHGARTVVFALVGPRSLMVRCE